MLVFPACVAQTGALSSLFYLAHEFHDDPKGGILANTNCGGKILTCWFALRLMLVKSLPRCGLCGQAEATQQVFGFFYVFLFFYYCETLCVFIL